MLLGRPARLRCAPRLASPRLTPTSRPRAAASAAPSTPSQARRISGAPGSSHPLLSPPAPPRPASLLQPRLPCNYHGAPTSGRSRRPRPPAGLRLREAGNSARPRPCPGLPRPGRASGSAPHARPPARPRVQLPAPLAPRGAPTRAVPSTRRLPQHTPVQSHQCRACRAATPARPPAGRPPTLSRAAPGSPQPIPGPGPAYRSCRAGSAALGPHDCPRLPTRVLPCP